MPPSGVNLIALPSEVDQDVDELRRIGLDRPEVGVEVELDLLRAGLEEGGQIARRPRMSGLQVHVSRSRVWPNSSFRISLSIRSTVRARRCAAR